MRKSLKALGMAAGAAAVVAALAVGSVAAQTATTPWSMHGSVIAKAASNLGVTEARFTEAMQQAHNAAIDDAVKAGQLTQAQADWMRAHQAQMVQGAGPAGMGPGMMQGGGFAGMGAGMMQGGGPAGAGPGMMQGGTNGRGPMGGRFGGAGWSQPVPPTR